MPYTGEYTSKKRDPLSEETKPHVTTGRRWSILARYILMLLSCASSCPACTKVDLEYQARKQAYAHHQMLPQTISYYDTPLNTWGLQQPELKCIAC
jgi:hypothetical protein